MTEKIQQKPGVEIADLVDALNEDLAREYQAIIAYTVYSSVLTGAQWMNIAAELKLHAAEELQHALIIADQIDYLGGHQELSAARQTGRGRRPLRPRGTTPQNHSPGAGTPARSRHSSRHRRSQSP